jgi:integrase
VHDRWLEQNRDNPSQQTWWNVDLADRLFAPPRRLKSYDISDPDFDEALDQTSFRVAQMEKWCFEIADERLAVLGIKVDEQGRRVSAKAISAAVQRASQTLALLAKGGMAPGAFSPAGGAVSTAVQSQSPLPLADLVKGWAAEQRPTAKTQYEWTRVARQLADYLGHSDARRLTTEDLIGWKQSMVEAGLRPKTIQDAKLAPMRAILQWGAQNKHIMSNPAEGVSLDARSKHGEKKRGFTDDEARVILRAALKATDAVRRWVPWIGAHTGARISEICQLRFEDIAKVEDIWCFKFVPEAGSLKTDGSERIVPLHPALIKGGLLEFVEKRKAGPLFADLSPDKFGKRGGNGTKMIGRFVRDLGLKDPRLMETTPSFLWAI